MKDDLAARIAALGTDTAFVEDVAASLIAGNNTMTRVQKKMPALVEAIAHALLSPTAGEPSEVPRDSLGRVVTIHGLVLNESNPAPTMRELLRQWSEFAEHPRGDLAERTKMVLEAIGPDGTAPAQESPDQ